MTGVRIKKFKKHMRMSRWRTKKFKVEWRTGVYFGYANVSTRNSYSIHVRDSRDLQHDTASDRQRHTGTRVLGAWVRGYPGTGTGKSVHRIIGLQEHRILGCARNCFSQMRL